MAGLPRNGYRWIAVQRLPLRRKPTCNCTQRLTLHSNNSFVVVIDAEDRTVYSKRLHNDLQAIVGALRSCPGEIQAVAVESTYNWYWLVDGLQEALTFPPFSTAD